MATKRPNILIIWGDDIGWYKKLASSRLAPAAALVAQYIQTIVESRRVRPRIAGLLKACWRSCAKTQRP